MTRRWLIAGASLAAGTILAGAGLYGAALTVGAPHATPDDDGPIRTTLSSAEMRSDLDTFPETLLAVGTDPFLTCAQPTFEAARVRAHTACTQPLSRPRFWRVAAELAASLNDGHVAIRPPSPQRDDASARFFPLGLAIDPDLALVVTIDVSSPTAVEVGSTLVAVDGVTSGELVAVAIRTRGGQTQALRRVLTDVPAVLESMVGSRDQHAVSFRTPAGEVRTTTLRAISRREWQSRRDEIRGPFEPYVFGVTPDRIARIDYNSCEDRPRFQHFLAQTFARIKREKPRAVVVDLRRNGGGNSALNNDLFAYLTDKPYAQAGVMRVRASSRLRHELGWLPYLDRYGPAAFLPNGVTFDLPSGPRTPPGTPLRYSGPTYYLIGPATFSSAQLCALAVRDFGLGTLVGEVTGEPAVSTGEVYAFRLPHSRLRTSVTTKTWLPAKHHPVGEGVRPDIDAPITARQIARA